VLAADVTSEFFADGFEFQPTLCGGLGIGHLKFIEGIQDDLGNNQPGILLIIGGNDVPGTCWVLVAFRQAS
jgi:hypothetical protein